MISRILLFLLLLPSLSFSAEEVLYDPPVVYLTWQRQPEKTMIIHWITSLDKEEDTVFFRKKNDPTWFKQTGSHAPLPTGHISLLIHTVELENLSPDTTYFFHPGSNTPSFAFKTMPETLQKPLRFAVGGDFYHDTLEFLEKTCRQAAKVDPRFVLLGGDIAYSASKDVTRPEHWQRWIEFLSAWKKTMVDSEGVMIPLIAALGNHDMQGHFNQTPAQAAFFNAFFLMPGERSYRVIDFGTYMSIWLLDSNFSHSVSGEQTLWLMHSLEKRRAAFHKMALYHVPAYPSVRSFHNPTGMAIRRHWVPLFERYGLDVAFENHDHAYKRTHLIRNNQIHPQGVLYLGDGGWGVANPRIPSPPTQRPYLIKSEAKRHFLLATITPESETFQAIDDEGIIFDEFTKEKGKGKEEVNPLSPLFSHPLQCQTAHQR